MPKSAKEKNETAVQGTNDSSIVSKCAITMQGYFHDDYLRHFVARQTRRAPLINRGYYVRAKAIDGALRHFLKSFQGQANQIVSLGAGFDSAFFRLESARLLSETCFYEIDFAEVACRKAAIIQSNDILCALLKEPVFHHKNPVVQKDGGVIISSSSYQLLGINLNDLSSLHRFLLHSGCDLNKPTLLLSECVLTYMEVQRSDALIEFCANTFSNAAFICYEQIYPSDSFGRVMMNHFKKLGSPLQAIRMYSTPSDHQERYLRLGWTSAKVIDMNEFYLCLHEEERDRIKKLEPFDEFEEWHLKCNHYILVTACKGSCITAFQDDIHRSNSGSFRMYQQKPQLDQLLEAQLPDSITEANFSGFGHSSERISSTTVLVHGGFGDKGGRHQRLSEMVAMNIHTGNSFTVEPEEGSDVIGPRMFHTITALNHNKSSLLIFGGRTSPTKPCHQTLLLTLSEEVSDVTWRYRPKVILGETTCPETRWRHTATAIRHNSIQGILIFGGKNLDTVFSDCFLLCNETLEWQKVVASGSIPEPRHSHSANLWQESAVIACGFGADERPLHSVCLLNCESWVWSRLETIPTLTPRYSHSGHILGDHLLLVGGIHLHGEVISSVTRINLKTACWKEYDILRESFELDNVGLIRNRSSRLQEWRNG
ncbi:putative tRNA wybutosine-synthesizing protein 4 [Apostichopus japonicus]|uniref:tRNA wybutosine-synthesizing protein 4 n=1 Tax=Stichopus japonicus TaxID=307972 RepID=A0A2G8JUX9_STIJA|nr:putative tRNA wybutosine-synthesizing protein 4 [Apostichopus japonicus]